MGNGGESGGMGIFSEFGHKVTVALLEALSFLCRALTVKVRQLNDLHVKQFSNAASLQNAFQSVYAPHSRSL